MRIKQNPHKYYIPNGKVAEFVKMVGADKNFVSFFCAANGVGKTASGAVILSHILWGQSGNEYFKNLPLFDNFKYPKRGRIVSDPTTVATVLIPELKKWFPPNRYISSKMGKNYEYMWRTDTGHSFEVMSLDQDPKEYESATLGWAWFDEPPTEAIFKATVARMRAGGIIYITATPLTGSSWLYDHIVTYKGSEGQRDYVQAEVEDNCKIHGVRGRLDHEAILKMVAEYTEDEKQARVWGKFAHLVGLVFKNFNRKIHIIRPFRITKRDFVVLEALDPHARNPDAVMWVGIDKNQTKFVIDELYGNFITAELAARIKEKAGGLRLISRIADPAAFSEDKHLLNAQGQTLASTLSNDYGISYLPGTKNRQRADRRIKDALDYELRGEEIVLAPELYIFDTCHRTIYEFEHYQWDEWRGRIAERKSPKEKPQDKDDHCLVGDTLVDCNEGQIKIKDLVGKTGLVYSVDGLKRFCNVRKTLVNAPVYRIIFTNGKFVEGTSNHLILSDNGWKELLKYKVGDSVVDIDIWDRYNRLYESKNYFTNRSGVFRKALLSLWKVFSDSFSKGKRFSFASSCLGISQRENTRGYVYSPQGQQSGEQSNRELKIEDTSRTFIRKYDAGKARVGEAEYVKQYNSESNGMAQISKSGVALRKVEKTVERRKKTSSISKSLSCLWQSILYSTDKENEVLREEMQSKGLGQVKKIEYIGLQDTYNMEVEGSHCFSVNSGIIVHNCIENLGRILLQEAAFTPLPLIMQPQASSIKRAQDFDPYAL